MGWPQNLGLGEGLTHPHRKNLHFQTCYTGPRGFFGTTWIVGSGNKGWNLEREEFLQANVTEYTSKRINKVRYNSRSQLFISIVLYIDRLFNNTASTSE
jgi:hypothetical protein